VTTKFDYCLAKVAEELQPQQQPKKNPHLQALKIIGMGAAGLGLGHAVGAGAGKAIEYFTRRSGGNPADAARMIAPVVGGAAGIIYPIWQAQQSKAIQNAVESAHNQSDGRVPGQ
jgi:hypothetical protein